MTEPWLGDACSLVDAFRDKVLSPVEALDGCLAAMASSPLNAFSFVDEPAARLAASVADVSLPFGGVPIGVKELDMVAGWPFTEASLLHADRVSDVDSTQVARLRSAGAVPVGLTTASEFGFVAFTSTKLNGTTVNPWSPSEPALTPGGSSGGSAAAVAGGLVPLATAGDGGGSIRKPAGYCGMVGLKTTYGRIPRGPRCLAEPLTETVGCISRSVRDTARWLDVCNGYDARDRFSLPRVEGWEAGLGGFDLGGLRACVSVDFFGTAVVDPAVASVVSAAASSLVASAGLRQVDVTAPVPAGGGVWALAGLISAVVEFGHLSAEERESLTDDLRMGLELATPIYGVEHAAMVERYRRDLNEALADVFEACDVVLCASNPWPPFVATGPTPYQVGSVLTDQFNDGALTIPANMAGYPAVSVPAGPGPDGLPVGLQIYGRRHEEALLLDLALAWERLAPWPLVAPGSPL
jgi:aspartyl-tRNA(Asn)/glutamyl-tRNA(Gln) amidotransferase subunit A